MAETKQQKKAKPVTIINWNLTLLQLGIGQTYDYDGRNGFFESSRAVRACVNLKSNGSGVWSFKKDKNYKNNGIFSITRLL